MIIQTAVRRPVAILMLFAGLVLIGFQARQRLSVDLLPAINYPNLTKAHFDEAFNKNNFETNSIHRLNDFLIELHKIVRCVLKQEDDLKSRIAVSQLFSAFLMIGMMPDIFRIFLNFDLKDKVNQQVFVETLLESFCK